MMATAAFVGLSAGKRLMFNSYSSSSSSSDLLLLYGGNSSSSSNMIITDHGGTSGGLDHHHYSSTSVNARKISNSFPSSSSSRSTSKSKTKSKSSSNSNSNQRLPRPVKALNVSLKVEPHHLFCPAASTMTHHDLEEQTITTTTCDGPDDDQSLEAILLLQKSMLETQWNLCFEPNRDSKIPMVYGTGVSARQRRVTSRRRRATSSNDKHLLRSSSSVIISPELVHNRFIGGGYVKGVVSDELLSHTQVVLLSKKIKAGLSLEDHKSRLRDRLGYEPSDEQLATSLKISRADLHSKLLQYSLAREKLAMSNVRLVMSIAQRYDHMGAEMSDLVQGGLIGLLRGIEKFDSSKGFKISTYVYWWIRQGVSRALVDNSRTLRLPAHLHERLGLIRNAKLRLEEKGITPSVDRIAECLNMSEKKVRNATEAVGKVFSLDRDAFPSLNGLPGESYHSYIADNRLENNPWHGVDEWALKDEVNKLLDVALGKRERQIIRLYYGLDNECLTWEDISKRIGLSRERVRQVGLVALEKLKHMARKRKMEAMLVKQ